jgi:hypothetical protein
MSMLRSDTDDTDDETTGANTHKLKYGSGIRRFRVTTWLARASVKHASDVSPTYRLPARAATPTASPRSAPASPTTTAPSPPATAPTPAPTSPTAAPTAPPATPSATPAPPLLVRGVLPQMRCLEWTCHGLNRCWHPCIRRRHVRGRHRHHGCQQNACRLHGCCRLQIRE